MGMMIVNANGVGLGGTIMDMNPMNLVNALTNTNAQECHSDSR